MNRASAASLSTANDTQTLTVQGNDPPIASALFGLSGTYGTAVVIFQGQLVSGGNWVNLAAALLETPFTIVSGNISPSDNTDYVYRVTSPEGLYAIRCKLVSIVSGTVVCNAVALTAKDVATQVLPLAINSSATPQNITSASATAFTVGPNGTTNPAFTIDASTSSAATGLKITAAASGSGVAFTAMGGTNEALKINAKGSGVISLGDTSTGGVGLNRGNLQALMVGKTLTSIGTSQSSTPTSAQLLGGIITQTGATGAGTITLPTGTALSTACPRTPATGDSFDCIFANLGGSQTLTVTGATGTTVSGGATIATAKTAVLTFVCTSANAWTIVVTGG